MSEAATAAPSAGVSTPAAASAQGSASNVTQGKTPEGTQTKVEGSEAKGPAATPEDESEEIKIGGVKGKVPKVLAKAMKDLERGFHSKSQELAQTQNYYRQLAEAGKTNPLVAEALLEQLGIDSTQFSQAKLAKLIEREMMSPEQLKAMELQEENRRYKEDADKRKEEADRERMGREEKQADLALRNEVMEAVQKTTLPIQHMTDRQKSVFMAQVVSAKLGAEQRGEEGFTWDNARAIIEDEWKTGTFGWVKALDPEQAEAQLGPEFFHRWREHDLKRVTGKASSDQFSKKSAGRPEAPSASTSDKSRKQMTEAEWREWANSPAS